MNYPIYIYYELLIRLSDFKPDIGEYLSNAAGDGGWILRTTKGRLLIPDEILQKQFNDPNEIDEAELRLLLRVFQDNYRSQF